MQALHVSGAVIGHNVSLYARLGWEGEAAVGADEGLGLFVYTGHVTSQEGWIVKAVATLIAQVRLFEGRVVKLENVLS